MKETDLSAPVETLFKNMGYEVQGEVKGVDLIAQKEDNLILIELKTTFNLKLIIQGAKNQRISDDVYLAIPAPNYKIIRSSAHRDKLLLLRRLGLGLIHVDVSSNTAKIILDAKAMDIKASQRSHKRKKQSLIKEANARITKPTTGGKRGKVMTAYRESTLLLVGHMADGDAYRPRDLVALTGIKNARAILYNNHYQWFDRPMKGHYTLTEEGKKALSSERNTIAALMEDLKLRQSKTSD